MKSTEFEREDGTKGTAYQLEDKDRVVSRFKAVGTRESAFMDKKTKKPKPVKNHFLGVTWEGKEITLKITAGQKKNLDKTPDLNGKTIVAYAYKNAYGDQVGAKVV